VVALAIPGLQGIIAPPRQAQVVAVVFGPGI